jgi:hypothetical protein
MGPKRSPTKVCDRRHLSGRWILGVDDCSGSKTVRGRRIFGSMNVRVAECSGQQMFKLTTVKVNECLGWWVLGSTSFCHIIKSMNVWFDELLIDEFSGRRIFVVPRMCLRVVRRLSKKQTGSQIRFTGSRAIQLTKTDNFNFFGLCMFAKSWKIHKPAANFTNIYVLVQKLRSEFILQSQVLFSSCTFCMLFS